MEQAQGVIASDIIKIGNGLVPDGTKPLTRLMSILVMFSWHSFEIKFYIKYSKYQSLKQDWKLFI